MASRSKNRLHRTENRLALEHLEPRLALDAAGEGDVREHTLTGALVLGSDRGRSSTPIVRVLDPDTGAVRARFLAYERSFRGGVRVTAGDVTGDGIAEIITAPGAGHVGEIRVFTQAGLELAAYRTRPFGGSWRGGVEVAAGPVTGPGQIGIVAAQESGGNLVRVFAVTPGAADPVANNHARQFRPFGTAFTGGVRLATADLGTFVGDARQSDRPDGVLEILAGSGGGRRATVVALNAASATTATIAAFQPLAATYRGGVFVSRLPGRDGAADRLLVSGGQGSGSLVETWAHAQSAPGGRAFSREAAFTAFAGTGAGVAAAALDTASIFTVQNLGGTVRGVRRNTAPSGGEQTTLPAASGVVPPQRIAVVRRAEVSITVTTDFRNGADGWTANAVDLPAVPDTDYQLDWGPRTLPAEIGTGTGFVLQGLNRSDDLFLYVTRQLGVADGIQPGARYQVAFSISLASNNPSGGFGVGGPPDSVWLKAGGSSIAPEGVIDALGHVRLNVDQGSQANGGTAATVAGSIGNGLPNEGGPIPYVSLVRQVVHAFPVQADGQGRLWLLAGIDSGFEGFTRIYLQRIDVHLTRLPA